MSLPDSPLILGSAGQYALIQRVTSAGSSTSAAVGATSTANAAVSALTIPILAGQGIQIRDVGFQIQDRNNSGKLSAYSLSAFIVILGGTNNNVPICIRGAPPADHTVGAATEINMVDFAGPAWGSQDWPFISASDFPQLQSTLAPNLGLQFNAVVRNGDAVGRAVTYQFSVIYEVWQSFQPAPVLRQGHLGY
jgi:hypothetical protein